MTQRSLAKLRTRQRLLAAAKQLVADRGYEAATLRDVAALAEMSTGAVFANFADKADLFNEVIVDDLAELLDEMTRAASAAATARDAVLAMLTAGYALHAERLSLVQAQMGFSWSCGRPLQQRRGAPVARIRAALANALQAGVASGELATSMDAELIAEMAWDSYEAGYRHAIFEGWGLANLRAYAETRIDVLLDGYRPAARPVVSPSIAARDPRARPLNAERQTALLG
ncbi:MAG TPA: TetR family transcriptional regulator [Caulobacteraceae bacterium]|jgi:AcrR family transcriptional regulator|nr:TetR family transcriptional regulator [Caulobacteraceae bacterium]